MNRSIVVSTVAIIAVILAGLVFYFNPFVPTESVTFSVNGISGNPQGHILMLSYNGQTRYYNYSQLPIRLNFKYGTKISYSWINITPSAVLIIPGTGSVAVTPDMYSLMTRYVFSSISGGIFPNLQSDNDFEITQSGDVIANYQTQYEVSFVPVTNYTFNGLGPQETPGYMSPGAGWYDAGSSEVFTVYPASGYYIVNIKASSTLSPEIEGSTISATVNGPGIIEAYFNKIPMILGNPELSYNGESWNLYLDVYNSGNSPLTDVSIIAPGGWGAYQSGPSQINPGSWGNYALSLVLDSFEPNQQVNFTVQADYEGQTISVPFTVFAGSQNPLEITNAEIINQTLSLSVKDNGPYSFTDLLLGVYEGSTPVNFITNGFNSSALKPGQAATLKATIPSAQSGEVYDVVVEGQVTSNVAYFASQNVEACTESSAPPNIQFISASASTSGFTFVIQNLGTTCVTLQKTAYIMSATNNQFIGLGEVTIVTSTGSALNSYTISPNSVVTINVTYINSTSMLQGNYYVKITTTSGYTIQSPTVYVS